MPALSVAELLVALAWGVAAAAGVVCAQRWRQRRGVRSRLATLNLDTKSGAGVARVSLRASMRSLASDLGLRLANRSAAGLEQRIRLLDGGGLGGRLSPSELVGWQVILAAAGIAVALAGSAVNPLEGLLVLPVLAVCGFMLPTLWLKRRQQARCQQLFVTYPRSSTCWRSASRRAWAWIAR